MPEFAAEQAYLFRHAVVRDAAYSLQLPADRARLHGLAFHLLEQVFGGRAPEPPPLDVQGRQQTQRHDTDIVAAELAEHTRLALDGRRDPAFLAARKLYLRRAAEYADRTLQAEAAARCWQQLAELLTGVARGEALRHAGGVVHRMGHSDAAESLVLQAVAIQREAASQHFEGIAQACLGVIYRESGRPAQAERAHAQGLALLQDCGSRSECGTALGNLANVLQETGRVEEAMRTYERALVILRESGGRRSEGVALCNLASAYGNTGRIDQAEGMLDQAVAIHREVGDRRFEGVALANLSMVYHQTGRLAPAEKACLQAAAILREVGDRRFEGMALSNLAMFYQSGGRLDDAEHTYGQALAIHRELGARRAEGVSLGNLAILYMERGRVEPARAAYEQAIAIHREVGNLRWRYAGSHLCGYGLCLLALRRVVQARQAWREGADIYRALGDTEQLNRASRAMREGCAKAGVPPLDEGPL